MYYNAHEMLKKARKQKNGGYKNMMDRWNNTWLQNKKPEREVMETFLACSRHKPIPPEQQVRQRLDQQFEGLEEYDFRLESSRGCRYYPSSTTLSSSSSRWQTSSDLFVVNSELGFVAIIILY